MTLSWAKCLRYETKSTIHKEKELNFIKINHFYTSKDIIKKMKSSQQMGKDIYKLYIW